MHYRKKSDIAVACCAKLIISDSDLIEQLEQVEFRGNQASTRLDPLNEKLKNLIEKIGGDTKAFESKVINERFTFHDIRHLAATEKSHQEGIEEARKMLAHSNQKVTSRYINGVQRVSPVKKVLDKSRSVRQNEKGNSSDGI